MADDLNAPLGLKKSGFNWRRLPFGMVGFFLLCAVIGGAVIWTAFFPDPLGGEPTAQVRIDRGRIGLGQTDIGVGDPTKGGPETGRAGTPPQAEPADGAKRPRIGMPAEGEPLPSSPLAKVTDRNKYGPVPKIAADGARPLDVYARPVPKRAGATPRVVVVVGGIGLSQTGTQEALRLLPPDVTLAVSPYGSSLDRWMSRARQDGHELLLQIPMEPYDYPDNDPGPHTLTTTATPEQNVDRLMMVLGRLTNYVGVVNYQGAKLTADEEKLVPVLRELAGRGVMYMDDGSSARSLADSAARQARVPFAKADLVIDGTATEAAIDARLTQLENLARSRGLAIGYGSALPVTIRKIGEWAKSLESRGVVIVPISAAARDGQSG